VLASVVATRYVTPLREGGSLPGLMEADDLGTYVVKFTGAGQGPKALIAEIVAGSLAASLGLPTPRLVGVEVDPILAANEPDEEVQELLRRSPGRNLGVDYLPGASTSTRARSTSTRPSPARPSGSTPSSATSTGRGATRTCCSGTGGLTSSITARR